MTRFRARRRRRAGLLLITAVGIVLGSLLPRIQAGATVPTARAGQVLAAVASGSWVWRLRRGRGSSGRTGGTRRPARRYSRARSSRLLK
jgi:hypothetical protein